MIKPIINLPRPTSAPAEDSRALQPETHSKSFPLQQSFGLLPRAGADASAPQRKTTFSDLPSDLIICIDKKLCFHDGGNLSAVNQQTFMALENERQLQIMGNAKVARNPDMIENVVKSILSLPQDLRSDPLQAISDQMGNFKEGKNKASDLHHQKKAMALYDTIWNEVVSLPNKKRARPLLAIARQVNLFPADQMFFKMGDALDKLNYFPKGPDFARLLERYSGFLREVQPKGFAMAQRLVEEAKAFPAEVQARIETTLWQFQVQARETT